jgi:hypothetical protein
MDLVQRSKLRVGWKAIVSRDALPSDVDPWRLTGESNTETYCLGWVTTERVHSRPCGTFFKRGTNC